MEMIIIYSLAFLLCLIILILMIIKKRKAKTKKDDEVEIVSKETRDLLPDIKYDGANECFIKENGECIDFIKIKSKDLTNASEDEILFDQYKYMKFYMTYAEDLKIICINFPCNTQIQQAYLRKKLKSTSNHKQKYWLNKRLEELIWLEKNRTTREYYFMFFSSKLEEYLKNKTDIITSLGTGRNGLVELITEEQKRQILFKMNNKSSLISQ